METVDWFAKNRRGNEVDQFVATLILRALTITPDILNKLTSQKGFDSSKLQIELKINGVEVPFVSTLESLNKEIDTYIAKKAMELIKEKFVDLENVLADVIDDFETKAAQELNVQETDED